MYWVIHRKYENLANLNRQWTWQKHETDVRKKTQAQTCTL